MQRPDAESFGELRRRADGALRVVVAGATGRSGSASVAAMLSNALVMAGMANGSVEVVDAGATLASVEAASAASTCSYVIVTGGTPATLTAAFGMVKAIETRQSGARIEILVTGQDEWRAHASYQRVRGAAERFLGRSVGFAGAITELDAAPADDSEEAESTRRRATRASRAARMWAARLLAECSESAWPDAAHSTN